MATTVQKKIYSGAYEPNIVVLEGASPSHIYVLQIWDENATTLISDLRISPNQNNIGVIDIKNILQSYVNELPIEFIANNVEYSNLPLHTTNEISFAYRLAHTSIAPGTTPPTLTVDTQVYEASLSRKWNNTHVGETPNTETGSAEFQTWIDFAGTCTGIDKQGIPLSDIKPQAWKDLPGNLTPSATWGVPTVDTLVQYGGKVGTDGLLSASWFSKMLLTNTGDPKVQGIEAFWVYVVQPDGSYSSDFIQNTMTQGGGPNTALGDGGSVSYPWSYISMNISPKDLQSSFGGDLVDGSRLIVYPVTYDACAEGAIMITTTPTHYPMVWDIVDETCYDYDHIEIGWLNSKGFYDWFLFTKRNEKSVNISRNTYLKDITNIDAVSAADVDVYGASPTWKRGTTVYSQKYDTIYTAKTDYIGDNEALTLESMYRSPMAWAWMKNPQTGVKEIYSIEIISNNYVERSFRKDGLFQYEVRFKLAQHEYTQRG
jgi:hypothetical protein